MVEVNLRDNTPHQGIAYSSDVDSKSFTSSIIIQSKPKIKLDKFYKQLIEVSQKLNSFLEDDKFIKANVHLFGGKDYDHNTRDNFLDVIGWNPENFAVQTGNLIGFVKTPDIRNCLNFIFNSIHHDLNHCKLNHRFTRASL
jgi:hypothetical protein